MILWYPSALVNEVLGMQLQPETYTIDTISAKAGKSQTYVYGRLRLTQLIPEAKQAFYEAKLTVAHAFRIARLQPSDQRRALQGCPLSLFFRL